MTGSSGCIQLSQIRQGLGWTICSWLVLMLSTGNGHTQSMYFGLKAGPTIAFQQWNGYQKSNPLLALHLMAHLESYGQASSFFLNAGINPKGRGLRFNDYVSPISGKVIRGGYSRIVFKNAEVVAGIKKYYELSDDFEWFYSFGVRGSYTYGTEFGDITYLNTNGLRKFNYGVSAGGGIRLISNEFFRPLLHITFSPDLSQQIYTPPQELTTPSGNRYQVPEQEIRNISLEIGVTLQFLRKVIYE